MLSRRPRLHPHAIKTNLSCSLTGQHICHMHASPLQALAAVSAQYRAVQQATAERLVADLFARQASAPAEMLQAMIQGGAEDNLNVQARLALCPCK